MKKKILFVLLVQFFIPWFAITADTENAESSMIRIGVDIRMGFQSCIDSWRPVAEYLSKAIPGHRFVIVPLASQQDLTRMLENGDVEFTVLNPALEIVAEDRYGTVPLATMVESNRDGIKQFPSYAGYGGAIIRRAQRSDIKTIQDIRGLRLSAVKPWSFTGWIAQWGFMAKNNIDPLKDVKQVVFEGTHGQVVKSVLDGSADAGTVDADLLSQMARNRKFPDNSLYIFNRQGQAVPLVVGERSDSYGYLSRLDFFKGRCYLGSVGATRGRRPHERTIGYERGRYAVSSRLDCPRKLWQRPSPASKTDGPAIRRIRRLPAAEG